MTVTISGTTGIQNVLGSASAPAESNTTTPTTGVYYPSATTWGVSTAGTNALYIDASQNVGIGTTSPKAKVSMQGTGSTLVNLIPENGSSNTYQNGIGFNIGFDGTNWTTIGAGSNGGSYIGTDYGNGAIKFMTVANTGGTAQSISNATFATYERMRIDSSGNLLVGTTSQQSTAILSVVGGASKNGIGIPVANGQTGIIVSNTGAYNYSAQTFFYNSSQVGTISISSTSTAYNTSSDYRLKTNVTPLTTAQSGPIIDALKPSQFTWKEDNSSDVGFIAHEIQAVIPRAVTGEKDAVDAEGKPVYQQVAVSSPEIIAYLVAEIQSLRARLKAANIA